MIRRSVCMSVLAGLVMAWCLALAPAETRAQGAVDATAVGEARKLLSAIKMEGIVDQVASVQMQITADMIAGANPGKEALIRKIMLDDFLPEFRNRIPEFIDEVAGLYAVHFSSKELQELNAFYASPIGLKIIQLLPTLTQQGMQMGQVWGQKVAQDALRKAIPKLREQGITL